MTTIILRSVIILFSSLTVFCQAQSQTPSIKILESGKRISIRGLSVVNDDIIWASGSNGSVARSTDGGNSFSWTKVPGFERMDFRDIEAFDSNTAIIMGITQPAVILKTKDGGKTWKKVFEDTTKGMFLDAMDFIVEKDKVSGMVIGDPINGKIFCAVTFDAGDSWETLQKEMKIADPPLTDGEAFFASSGTNIKAFSGKGFPRVFVVSGGKSSKLWSPDMLFTWHSNPLPIMQGKESTGANSIDINNDHSKAVIVGGDFTKDTLSNNNAVLVSFDNPIKLSTPQTPPHGYRSCVIYLSNNILLTCGTSGIDLSKDSGLNWELISKESYHVCQKAKNGNAVFLAGSNGKIARLVDF